MNGLLKHLFALIVFITISFSLLAQTTTAPTNEELKELADDVLKNIEKLQQKMEAAKNEEPKEKVVSNTEIDVADILKAKELSEEVVLDGLLLFKTKHYYNDQSKDNVLGEKIEKDILIIYNYSLESDFSYLHTMSVNNKKEVSQNYYSLKYQDLEDDGEISKYYYSSFSPITFATGAVTITTCWRETEFALGKGTFEKGDIRINIVDSDAKIDSYIGTQYDGGDKEEFVKEFLKL